MNRADRRRKERELHSKFQTIKKLTPKQAELIKITADGIAREQIEELSLRIDKNLSAALSLIGLDTKEINDIEKLLVDLTEEDVKKHKRLQQNFNEKEFEEYMKKVQEEVKQAAVEMFEEGVTNKHAIEDLAFKFPALSKSMLTNAYHQIVKEQKQRKEESKDPEVGKAVAYVFEEDKKAEANKKDAKSKPKKASQKKQDKGLKIKSMVVEGKNGLYKACSNGVELQSNSTVMSFENVQQLEEFTKEYEKVFEMIK